MTSAIVCTVTMGTGLALSVDPHNPNIGGHVVLSDLDPSSALQRWEWVFYPPTQSSILYNPHVNGFVAPSSLDKGAHLVIFNAHGASYNGANTWQVFNDSAVRLPVDNNLNMNALGNSWGPGTEVGVYSWSGGAANERWTSRMIGPVAGGMKAA